MCWQVRGPGQWGGPLALPPPQTHGGFRTNSRGPRAFPGRRTPHPPGRGRRVTAVRRRRCPSAAADNRWMRNALHRVKPKSPKGTLELGPAQTWLPADSGRHPSHRISLLILNVKTEEVIPIISPLYCLNPIRAHLH